MGLSEKYINIIEHPAVEATINFIKKFKSSKSYWSVSYFILLFTIREAIAWKFGSAIKTFFEAQAIDSSFPMFWSLLGFVFDVGGSIELVLLGTFIFVLLSLVKVAESEGTSVSVRENYLTIFLIVFVGSISFYQHDEVKTLVKDSNERLKNLEKDKNVTTYLVSALIQKDGELSQKELEINRLWETLKSLAKDDESYRPKIEKMLDEKGLDASILYLKLVISYLKNVEKGAVASQTNIKVSDPEKETIELIEDMEEENNETIIISKKSETKWIKPSDGTCIGNGGKVDSNGCTANWEDAKTICVANGGSLPSIEALRKVVTDCGGEMKDDNSEEWERNRDNATFQSCYKEKGFSYSLYWSKTVKNDSSAWLVGFSGGNDSWFYKTLMSYVLCVSGQ